MIVRISNLALLYCCALQFHKFMCFRCAQAQQLVHSVCVLAIAHLCTAHLYRPLNTPNIPALLRLSAKFNPCTKSYAAEHLTGN